MNFNINIHIYILICDFSFRSISFFCFTQFFLLKSWIFFLNHEKIAYEHDHVLKS